MEERHLGSRQRQPGPHLRRGTPRAGQERPPGVHEDALIQLEGRKRLEHSRRLGKEAKSRGRPMDTQTPAAETLPLIIAAGLSLPGGWNLISTAAALAAVRGDRPPLTPARPCNASAGFAASSCLSTRRRSRATSSGRSLCATRPKAA